MKKKIYVAAICGILLLGSVVILYPVFLMFVTSLKTTGEITMNPTGMPASLQWSNYIYGIQEGNLIQAGLNSIVYTALTVAAVVLFSSSAAFVLTRFSFRGLKALQIYFISGLMIPFQVVLIPLFKMVKALHLFNSLPGVVMIYTTVGLSFAILLYTGALKSVPRELEEAASIDGCGSYRLFPSVVFPLLAPTTATIVIFNIISVWNDFFIPLVFVTNPKMKPIQLAIYSFVGEFTSQWNIVFACMVMASLPVIVVYLFLQRYFIAGIMSGAVKG